MGRGGTDLLWSSGMTCTIDCSQWSSNRSQSGRSKLGCSIELRSSKSKCEESSLIHNRQGYRDKPYGQLVSVSLMHYCTSTPDLSTSWSRTTLQGAQGSGKSHLKASFPLRCFQRLSLPNLATRQCHWRDNRYTRGSSTPVLSY